MVEDDWLIAEDLRWNLEAEGAKVLGPVASVEAALLLLAGGDAGLAVPDLALLDVNLGGETVFPVADALAVRGIPFVFTTSRLQADMPRAYAQALYCRKPVSLREVVRMLEG